MTNLVLLKTTKIPNHTQGVRSTKQEYQVPFKTLNAIVINSCGTKLSPKFTNTDYSSLYLVTLQIDG